MTTVFGYPLPAIMGQLVLGLINGSFYALLSMGLAVIFGMLNVINFAHGAVYMLGAFLALLALNYLHIPFWGALVLVPLVVAAIGVVFERLLLSRLYGLDPLYGLLLTFGAALVLEGTFNHIFGSAGQPYPAPDLLHGPLRLGFTMVPLARIFAVAASVVVCFATWFTIERTRLGAYLRAATENPSLLRAFGVNVPLLRTGTYAAGVGLAGLAGVLAAPVYQVSPGMGSELIIIVFAIVVVGGMGSILGAIVTGYVLGIFEAFVRLVYGQASDVAIFVIMVVVLLVRPAGLFGRGD